MHATLSPSWKKSLLLVFVSVVAFVTATPATSGPQCFFQGLGFLLGGNQSRANGVSANGKVVVGEAFAASGQGQAFRWTAETGMVGLGFLPVPPPFSPISSSAAGVNADGKVVVGTSVAGPVRPLREQAFRWTAATGMVGLGFLPGGNFSDANGVNADGTVVVGGSSQLGMAGQAFRWVNGTMTGLGFLPGDIASVAAGVNADGTVVVGDSGTPRGQTQAFRWTAETGMVGLGFLPGGTTSNATGVNADGKVVVGAALDASGAEQAFRWTARTRMQSVLTLLQAAKADVNLFSGWQLRSANGVSADGTVITGDGVDPLGQSQGWIARLPKESNEDCEEDDDNQGDNDNQGEDFGR
jgi:probable HAF family extracellular repeat protein